MERFYGEFIGASASVGAPSLYADEVSPQPDA
jgi:hypothetical protein